MEVEDLVEEVEIIEVVPQSVELPYDILLRIFEYLSVGSRRNARLVCKKWFEACNERRFREKEAFFFNASYSFAAIVKIIAESGRQCVNLKLQSYELDGESNCLWETCGSKIASLKLSSCRFDGLILGRIIFSCPNMTELCVNGGSYNTGPLPFGGMFLCTKFKHAEERTLKREKLERLEFDADLMPIIYPDLERISTYFPNLKSLIVNLCTEQPLAKEKDLTHFHFLLELLSAKTTKIDTLYVDFHGSDTLLNALPILKLKCMADRNLSKLKDVGMRFTYCTLNDDSLNTILRFKFWTSLHITVHRIAQEKFNKFVITLLEQCPSLTFFGTYWKISKDSQFFAVFPALAKSRLKSLGLEIDDRSLPESQADGLLAKAKNRFKNLPKNNTVRQLTLKCAQADGFSSIFMEHFPNVKHLKLSHGSTENVFTSLPNLFSIVVGDNVSCREWFSKTPRTSVANLQYMSISIFSFDEFSQIKFPDLKFLTLTLSSDELFLMNKTGGFDEYIEDYDDAESFPGKIASILSAVAENAPNLRGLAFNFGDLNDRYLKCETGNCSRDALAAFFKSCQNLQQLRYVGTEVQSSKIGEEFCKQHMIECYKEIPSLRAVLCVTEKERLASFLNILENKVEFNEAVSRKRSVFCRLAVEIDMMDYWLEQR